MFPPMLAIDDHFKARDITSTKQICNEVIQYFFGEGKVAFLEPNPFTHWKNSHYTMRECPF